MNHGIYLSIKDLQVITGKTYISCARIMQHLRDALNKNKVSDKKSRNYQQITISEYCSYEGIDQSEILNILNIK